LANHGKHPEIFGNFHFLGREPVYFTGTLIHSKIKGFLFHFRFYHLLVFPLEIGVFENGMDELSSKTACVMPQNSPIDDWMSFRVKRSQKFLRNLSIRVNAGNFQLSF